MLEAVIFVVFPFCMVHAAVSDALSMTIANRVSLLLIGTFAVAAPLTGMAWDVYAWHFTACALVLAVTFGLFALGGMGGGDAKLMTATALWIGFNPLLVQYFLIAAILGGVMAFAILKLRSSALATVAESSMLLRNFADERKGVPYGIALGASGLILFQHTALGAWAMQSLVQG